MTIIDRDELLKKIAPMGLSNGSALGHHSGTADVIAEMVQNAPTIDPESLRGHAKWVKDKELKFIIVAERFRRLGLELLSGLRVQNGGCNGGKERWLNISSAGRS